MTKFDLTFESFSLVISIGILALMGLILDGTLLGPAFLAGLITYLILRVMFALIRLQG
jgi:hypothetical protein